MKIKMHLRAQIAKINGIPKSYLQLKLGCLKWSVCTNSRDRWS